MIFQTGSFIFTLKEWQCIDEDYKSNVKDKSDTDLFSGAPAERHS
jgi:hypothetical protein